MGGPADAAGKPGGASARRQATETQYFSLIDCCRVEQRKPIAGVALLLRNFVCSNSVLLRRRLLERTGLFDESLRSAEDYDLWLRASVNGDFLYEPTLCAYDPVTPGSVSTDLPRNFAANERILRRFFDSNPDYNTTWLRRSTRARFYAVTSHQWSGAGNARAALRDAMRSMGRAPWLVAPYRALLSAVAGSVLRR
jgi:GT2 family glycosyltransferase